MKAEPMMRVSIPDPEETYMTRIDIAKDLHDDQVHEFRRCITSDSDNNGDILQVYTTPVVRRGRYRQEKNTKREQRLMVHRLKQEYENEDNGPF